MKKLTKKAKTIIAGIALAAGLNLSPVNAQTNASLEAITSLEQNNTYLRPTIIYNLGNEIKGMTFHEFYQDKTHFGKTTLSKNVTDEQALMLQAIYGTFPQTTAGIGVSSVIPSPKGTFAKIYFVPLWANSEGINQDRSIVGYYVSANLPLGMKFHSFGEINVAEKNPKWGYGEIGIEKNITEDLSISYQPALYGTGLVTPALEHRVDIKYRLPVSKKD